MSSDTSTRIRRSRPRGERAQGMVEFALIFPFFVLLLMSIIDFGWALRTYVTINNAAREGARYGVTCKSDTAIKDRVVDYSSDLLAPTDVTVTLAPTNACASGGAYPDPAPDPSTSLQVSVSYQYHWITPLGGMIDVLVGGLTMRSTSKMHFE